MLLLEELRGFYLLVGNRLRYISAFLSVLYMLVMPSDLYSCCICSKLWEKLQKSPCGHVPSRRMFRQFGGPVVVPSSFSLRVSSVAPCANVHWSSFLQDPFVQWTHSDVLL